MNHINPLKEFGPDGAKLYQSIMDTKDHPFHDKLKGSENNAKI